jgi:hypothetical protein
MRKTETKNRALSPMMQELSPAWKKAVVVEEEIGRRLAKGPSGRLFPNVAHLVRLVLQSIQG